MDIIIPNIEIFTSFISSINKIVPSCEFNVGTDKTTVYGVTDNDILRLIMETNCMKSIDEPFSFCFQDLGKIVKVVNMVASSEKIESIVVKFNKSFLSYDNVASFKIKVAKKDIVQMYISEPLKHALTSVYSFNADSAVLKGINQQINVVATTESKVYLILKNDKVICEIADKTNLMADSIGMPLAEKVNGTFDDSVIMTMDVFRMINFMNADSIEFAYNSNSQGNRVVSIKSSIAEGDTYVNSQLVYRPLKAIEK